MVVDSEARPVGRASSQKVIQARREEFMIRFAVMGSGPWRSNLRAGFRDRRGRVCVAGGGR